MAVELCSASSLLGPQVVERLSAATNSLVCLPTLSAPAPGLGWLTPLVAFLALCVACLYYFTSLSVARDRDLLTVKQHALEEVRSLFTNELSRRASMLATLNGQIPNILVADNVLAERTKQQLMLRSSVHDIWTIIAGLTSWLAMPDREQELLDFGDDIDAHHDRLALVLAKKISGRLSIDARIAYAQEATAQCLELVAAVRRLVELAEMAVRDRNYESEVAPLRARLPLGRVWAPDWHQEQQSRP